MNPMLKRIAARGQTGHGNISEKRVAKQLKAVLRPGSGALQGAKGDMEVGSYLVEAKATHHATMSLDLGWLVKIAHEALAKGQTPAVAVSFTNPDGSGRTNGDWVMVPARVFQERLL